MSREIFSIPAFIAWAETQPLETEYTYSEAEICVMTQYFQHFGVKLTGSGHYGPVNIYNDPWDKIAIGRPRTIGAALDRARAVVEG